MSARVENQGGKIIVDGKEEVSPYTWVIDGVSYILTTSGTNILITGGA